MPLRFLVPAFLAGLAALAIPVLIHLTRKQRAEVVEFPSLMFLEQIQYQAESRRRIHHWLLLLVRALAVALIVAAFARPFFDDAEVAAGSTVGPREVVLLVDRSYSMQVGGRWERARDAAREAIAGLGPLDRASLVFFSGGAQVAARSTADRARLRSSLDTASLNDEATSYGPGLKLAQTILEDSDLPARELVMIGDFQRAGWTGDEGVTLPPGTVVTPVRVGEGAVPDRAVSGVNLARQRVNGRERITPSARVTRVGGDGEAEVDVVLELDGRELQRRTVSLPAAGATSVGFQPFTLADRHTRGTIRLAEPDELAANDAHHFVLSPGRALSVLVLDDATDRAASSLYLTRALQISPDNRFDVTVRAGGGAAPGDLDGRSVVIVNDRPVPGGGTADALRAFVEGGGGLIVVLGERIRWPSNLADLLPGSFTSPVDREDGRGGRLGQVEYDHPVFELFRTPRSGDLTSARFFRARGLQVPDDGSARVLARFDDGSVALAEKQVGAGRVLVWTSTLDAFWNDLALQPVFLPFVHQLVRHASGRSETLDSFTAGQVIDVTDARAMETAGLGEAAEALAGDEERVALTPSGATLPLPTGEARHFLELREQGFYEIRPPGADEVRPLAVAVNVDLAEADLEPLDVEEVASSLTTTNTEGRATAGVADPDRAGELRLQDQERRQSLWRFLLIGAFALLAAETVISNWISRAEGRRRSHVRT